MNTYCLAVLHKFGELPKRASRVYIERNKTVNYVPDAEHVERQKFVLRGSSAMCYARNFTQPRRLIVTSAGTSACSTMEEGVSSRLAHKVVTPKMLMR